MVILATGFGLFARRTWAGVTAILICDAQRDLELLLHPVLPDLGVLLIGLNVWVIWALTRPGAIKT